MTDQIIFRHPRNINKRILLPFIVSTRNVSVCRFVPVIIIFFFKMGQNGISDSKFGLKKLDINV